MNTLQFRKIIGSVALVIGLGLALGSSTGSSLTGLMVALPLGLATYYGYQPSESDHD